MHTWVGLGCRFAPAAQHKRFVETDLRRWPGIGLYSRTCTAGEVTSVLLQTIFFSNRTSRLRIHDVEVEMKRDTQAKKYRVIQGYELFRSLQPTHLHLQSPQEKEMVVELDHAWGGGNVPQILTPRNGDDSIRDV